MSIYDILIVGGGVAGLRLAIEAKKVNKKLKILIIEKYSQMGGRMQTIHKKINGKEIQYESGAGRICTNHHKLLNLIQNYGLHITPISSKTEWRKYGNQNSEPNNFEEIWYNLCLQLSKLPKETLRSKTLRDLAIETLGVDLTQQLFDTYPYRAELEVSSAESAIDLYLSIGNKEFVILNEGFSELIHLMTKEAKQLGVKFVTDITINRVDVDKNQIYKVTSNSSAETDCKIFEGKRVVLAVHRNALEKIYPFSMEHPLVKAVRMEPLLRIYSVYKDSSWFPSNKVVTNSPLRYIIPINKSNGLIMSSYLDSRDIELWSDLYKKNKVEELKDKIHNETSALFLEKSITEKPSNIFPEYWRDGCSYWLLDTDYKALSKLALQPYPDDYPNLHIVGESFSLKQQWIEGSLEHADDLISLIKNSIS